MRRQFMPALCALVAGPVAAQSFVVSPLQYTGYEAAAASDAPFSGAGRSQQIHGDLRGTARSFTGIAWRRDGQIATNPTLTARTLDMEVLMANSTYASASATYANNYVGSPTTVFTRKSVGLPDQTQQPDSPAPWTVNLAFDVPFPYAGTNDLVWELKQYSNVGQPSTAYWCDAVSGRDSAALGGSASVGTGCTTAHGIMRLRSVFTTNAGNGTLGLAWSLSGGPTNTVSVLLVGRTNPNVFLPLLCPPGNYLYTDLAFFALVGTTDAAGTGTFPSSSVPFSPLYAGAAVTSQAVAIDNNQAGYGVAASNGLTSTVAPAPAPITIARVQAASSSATAPTGTLMFGYGLVTRFQY